MCRIRIACAITSLVTAAVLLSADVAAIQPATAQENRRHCTSGWAASTALPPWSTTSSSDSWSTRRSTPIQRSTRRERACRRPDSSFR